MSCWDFVERYAIEKEIDRKDQILNEGLECILAQEERRDEELYEFVNDFINSEEYREYVKKKKHIMKRAKSTQCTYDDIVIEYKKKEATESYPLTQERRKMYAFKQQFEKYAEKEREALVRKRQEHGIQIIKAKINEARKIFDCTWAIQQRERERLKEYLLLKYSKKFDINNVDQFSQKTQSKLLERFKKYHEMKLSRQKRRQENVHKILKKLVIEFKHKKQLVKEKNEPPSAKEKIYSREKVMKDFEIVGTKIELVDRNYSKEEADHGKIAELEESETIKSVEQHKAKNKSGSPREKKAKEVKSGNKAKKTKDKKAAKTKSGKKEKKKKEKLDEFILPVIPNLNPREKILPENIDKILDILDDFRKLDDTMENRSMFQVQKQIHLNDNGLVSKPNTIIFRNFNEGRSYNKTVTITNVSPQIRKLRFQKFVFSNEYDETVFEVEPFGISKLFTGCSVKFRFNFEPYDALKPYEGKVIFLSYDTHLCQYYQFEVDVKCVPKYPELKVYPEALNFGSIPIWRAGNYEHFKVIRLQNKGAAPCTVFIEKQFDPLGIEEIIDEEDKENLTPAPKNSTTSFHDIQEILEECLRNLDNNFQFQQSFFTLQEYDETRLKVYFKNATFVGNYFEQYAVNVYNNLHPDCLDPIGCQIISIYAETTGHFLTATPTVLDFGTCLPNSCYQLSFEVRNSSGNSQAVCVKIPSQLAEVVRPDVSMVYLNAKGARTIYLKLSPKISTVKRSCSYFDRNSSILEFNVQLHVVSKLQSFPPVKIPVYAVMVNYEDLTISCNHTKHLSNFLDTLLIDMGDCSIYETVWTDLSLTNNTEITQICGFLDLPPYVHLEPNYGFCKLAPGQRKKLKMYVSPEIKDFPSYPLGTLRNSSCFFSVKVETIANLGQLLPQTSQKKSECSYTETPLVMYDNEFTTSVLGFVENLNDAQQLAPSESLMNRMGYSINQDKLASAQCSAINTASMMQGSPMRENSMDSNVVLNYQNFLIVETDSRREIWCRANLRKPNLEFSHQSLNFPDTACGSYSIMTVVLFAHETELEKQCKLKTAYLDFKASFQIFGDSDEIVAEPTCGVLESGEKRDSREMAISFI